MRLLVIATKPPWPPRDGGRLVLWHALAGLAAAGCEIALVAPRDAEAAAADEAALAQVCRPHLVDARRRSWPAAAFAALRSGSALSVARHRLDAVQAEVARCVETFRPDLVHAEQLQAFAHCGPARRAGLPCVLRMQNVESALWRQTAAARRGGAALAIEARRLARDEAAALTAANACVALTAADAAALANAAPAARVTAVAPAFPTHLPAAAEVKGAPALALAGSQGWWPNREGLDWFLRDIAPALQAACPQMRVHVYGPASQRAPGLVAHAAPQESLEAFPGNAIAVLPLRIGSGIRMRILEAWARGLPVVATAVAAAGLDVVDGRELLLADDTRGFVDAIARLHADASLRAALVDAGRRYLAQRHDPRRQTEALLAQYRQALAA